MGRFGHREMDDTDHDAEAFAEKSCTQCGETKPLGSFKLDRRAKDGRHSWCKACAVVKQTDWNRENKDKHNDYRLRQMYGITAEERQALHDQQEGGCAICGATQACGRGFALHVDHDHATGKVRGLLCGNCNRALALLREDPFLFESAVNYLERTKACV